MFLIHFFEVGLRTFFVFSIEAKTSIIIKRNQVNQ